MRWSSNGANLAGGRDGQVVVCTRSGGYCQELTSGTYPVWSADGAIIYFQRYRDDTGTYEAWAIALDGSNETKLADLGAIESTDGTFDVSLDGHLAWVQYLPGRHELWLAQLE